MQSLKNLAKRHSTAIITSIHQPNQEIVLMFDKVYVLAKGGNCIYSGGPNGIAAHLRQNKRYLTENEVPIEHLLKLGSVEADEQQIDELIDKTKETLRLSVFKECQNQTKLSASGIKRESKSFSFSDLWYLLSRTMTQTYVRQWKSLLFQLLFYLSFALLTCKLFDEDIGKPDACFDPVTLGNNSCLKELEDDSLLYQNQNIIFFISLMILFTHLCSSALVYCTDAKIFLQEHQNCMN